MNIDDAVDCANRKECVDSMGNRGKCACPRCDVIGTLKAALTASESAREKAEKERDDLAGLLSRCEGTMNLARAYLESVQDQDNLNDVAAYHARSLCIAAGACNRATRLKP